MKDREYVEMMQRCKHEIASLRREIDRLRPKADAYDSVAHILSLLPRQSQGMSEDLMWLLDKRIKEVEQNIVNAALPVAAE